MRDNEWSPPSCQTVSHSSAVHLAAVSPPCGDLGTSRRHVGDDVDYPHPWTMLPTDPVDFGSVVMRKGAKTRLVPNDEQSMPAAATHSVDVMYAGQRACDESECVVLHASAEHGALYAESRFRVGKAITTNEAPVAAASAKRRGFAICQPSGPVSTLFSTLPCAQRPTAKGRSAYATMEAAVCCTEDRTAEFS